MGNFNDDFALAKCITFYSYKGGSGRSTALVNTAKHLIDELKVGPSNPMLIVDADLESAGLTFFFDLSKKFTGKFQQSINTASLIFQNGKYFENNTADNAFGVSGPTLRNQISDLLIEKLQSVARSHYNVKELLEGVRVNTNEKLMLDVIIEACANHIFSLDSSEKKRDYEIYLNYNVLELLEKISKIHNDPFLSESDKRAKKEKAISDHLPAQEFADISHFFDAPKGSVKFLGADIQSKDIIPHGKDLPSNIKKLLFQCSLHGYSTVLFDSGAGTQSTPYSLHLVSDVLIYCMRPSKQFIGGTLAQLTNCRDDLKTLAASMNKINSDRKMVIILPTAVAKPSSSTVIRCEQCFEKIKELSTSFPDIIDPSFCTQDTALPEVELFKWCEIILGTSLNFQPDLKADPHLAAFTDYKTMPEDAKKAYDTYKRLAKRIIYNCEVN